MANDVGVVSLYVFGEFYEIHTYTMKIIKKNISLEICEMRKVIIFLKRK